MRRSIVLSLPLQLVFPAWVSAPNAWYDEMVLRTISGTITKKAVLLDVIEF